MKAMVRIMIIILLYISAGYVEAYSGLDIDFETGAVFSGYNDLRIPNKTGTDISFSEELKTDSTYFIRGKINYSIKYISFKLGYRILEGGADAGEVSSRNES